jgi:hypothetical protein
LNQFLAPNKQYELVPAKFLSPEEIVAATSAKAFDYLNVLAKDNSVMGIFICPLNREVNNSG